MKTLIPKALCASLLILSSAVFGDHSTALLPIGEAIYLGETRLDRKLDREGIGSPPNRGIVAIEFTAANGDGYIEAANFTFGNGQQEAYRLDLSLSEGQKSPLILLRTGPRRIQSIHIIAKDTTDLDNSNINIGGIGIRFGQKKETRIQAFGYQEVSNELEPFPRKPSRACTLGDGDGNGFEYFHDNPDFSKSGLRKVCTGARLDVKPTTVFEYKSRKPQDGYQVEILRNGYNCGDSSVAKTGETLWTYPSSINDTCK